MPIRLRAPWRAALAAAAAPALLAACATPLQPVADFGGAATHLAVVYKPFATGLGTSCEERLRYQAIGNPGPFDDASAQADAARECGPLKKEAATAALFAQALSDYATALATVVDAMKTYAGAIYAGQLQDTQDVMKGELGRLVRASNAPTQADVEARLPWRWAQTATRADIAANELELRRVRAFSKTADALLAAHLALIDNFDKLDGAKRLALVSDFVNEVQAIDDDVAAL